MINFSKKTAIAILDKVNEDYAKPILDMKLMIEKAYIEDVTKREMKARGCGGHSLFSDNVGKVINPRY